MFPNFEFDGGATRRPEGHGANCAVATDRSIISGIQEGGREGERVGEMIAAG